MCCKLKKCTVLIKLMVDFYLRYYVNIKKNRYLDTDTFIWFELSIISYIILF